MSARVVDAPTHPQALFFGFGEGDAELESMSSLVTRARTVRDLDELYGLRIVEWDVVVARGGEVGDLLRALSGDIFVLSYGGADSAFLETDEDQVHVSLWPRGEQRSPELRVAPGLSPKLAKLVSSDLIPWLQGQDVKPYLTVGSSRGARSWMTPNPPMGTPFIQDADGNVFAGEYECAHSELSDGSAGTCWVLPHRPARPELWLDAALDVWDQVKPQRFVDRPAWWMDTDWQTPQELAAREELVLLEAEASAAQKRFEERLLELDAKKLAAERVAIEGRRRLLVASGPDLVEAVAEALRSLGFEVTDADAETPDGMPKMEDLRVRDPQALEWTNITEVKGYTGGGKTSDLQALGRFAGVFQIRTGAFPASRCYVVNQFREHDPGTRQRLLAGADEDLVEFAKSGGLAIDSRQLFRLVNDVELENTSQLEARRILRSASGRLAY